MSKMLGMPGWYSRVSHGLLVLAQVRISGLPHRERTNPTQGSTLSLSLPLPPMFSLSQIFIFKKERIEIYLLMLQYQSLRPQGCPGWKWALFHHSVHLSYSLRPPGPRSEVTNSPRALQQLSSAAQETVQNHSQRFACSCAKRRAL